MTLTDCGIRTSGPPVEPHHAKWGKWAEEEGGVTPDIRASTLGAVTEIFGSLFTEKKHMVRIVGGLTMTDQVRNDLRAKGKAHKHSPNAEIFYNGTPPHLKHAMTHMFT